MRKKDTPISNCKVITLTNQKGSVVKTTTAVNLGHSRATKSCSLMLADAQVNLAMSLGYHRLDDLLVTLSAIIQDIIEDNLINVQKSILHYGKIIPADGLVEIVSLDENGKGNKHSTTVVVSELTGKEHVKPNLHTKDSIILLKQTRTFDKQRLQEYIDTFDRSLMIPVDKALAISIGISKKD